MYTQKIQVRYLRLLRRNKLVLSRSVQVLQVRRFRDILVIMVTGVSSGVTLRGKPKELIAQETEV